VNRATFNSGLAELVEAQFFLLLSRKGKEEGPSTSSRKPVCCYACV
jgi:hypothetical protein